MLCRSKIKKAWDNTRHFCKKHKKKILIGAGVVVGVAASVTAIVLTCGAATGAVVAVAETAIAAASQIGSDSSESKQDLVPTPPIPPPPPLQNEESLPIMPVLTETPLLQEALETQAASFKETVFANIMSCSDPIAPIEPSSFLQNIRNLGSKFAHDSFDALTNFVSEVPRFEQEVFDLTRRYLPLPFGNAVPNINLIQDFERKKASGHRFVDSFFGTDQAKFYTPQALESQNFEWTYGILPPPGSLAGSSVASEGRLIATQCNSICGWRVGDQIHNRTWWGGKPTWNTVRQRYWKNQAQWAKSAEYHDYGDQIPRMEKGLAPQRKNKISGQWESKELHHMPPQRDGGLFDFIEVWPDEHAQVDNLRRLGK